MQRIGGVRDEWFTVYRGRAIRIGAMDKIGEANIIGAQMKRSRCQTVRVNQRMLQLEFEDRINACVIQVCKFEFEAL